MNIEMNIKIEVINTKTKIIESIVTSIPANEVVAEDIVDGKVIKDSKSYNYIKNTYDDYFINNNNDLRVYGKIEIAPPGKHFCLYCGELADSDNPKLLCSECSRTFEHNLFSEL